MKQFTEADVKLRGQWFALQRVDGRHMSDYTTDYIQLNRYTIKGHEVGVIEATCL